MKVPYLDLTAQLTGERDDLHEIMGHVVSSGQYILGHAVIEFEQAFAAHVGTRYAVGVNSGTDALFLALKALGIGSGDEVITVANSFIATAGAIVAAGAKPVFVDVRYDDMLIDTDLIEEAITPRTRAIIPVHLGGHPSDMDTILAISDKYGLLVIEDAAQSFDALYHGRQTGSFGHCGAFSLIPLKNLGGFGDAGIITTNDAQTYDRLVSLRNHGLVNRDEAPSFGYNSRLDTLNAAVLHYRLKKSNIISKTKRDIALFYDNKFSHLKRSGRLQYNIDTSFERSVYHLFVIKTEKRDELMNYLSARGVETKVHYPKPIHQQKAYTDLFGETSLPVTEKLSKTMLSLPCWFGIGVEQLDYICEMGNRFFTR